MLLINNIKVSWVWNVHTDLAELEQTSECYCTIIQKSFGMGDVYIGLPNFDHSSL